MRAPILAAILTLTLVACSDTAAPGAKSPAFDPSKAATWEERASQVPGLTRELRYLKVAYPDGTTANLDTLITRPAVDEPVPLIILSHGRPADPKAIYANQWSRLSIVLARRGYGVAVVLRRGYGHSTGAESPTSCAGREYAAGSHPGGVDDIVGAATLLSSEPWVDPSRIALLGFGALSGGLASWFAAEAPARPGAPSFRAVVSLDDSVPPAACAEPSLLGALTEVAHTGKTPALLVDCIAAPPADGGLLRRMANAFAAGGGTVDLQVSTATEADRPDPWWPTVAPFLAKAGLPTDDPPPGTISENPPLFVPPYLSSKCQAMFAEYLATDQLEKAFAYGNHGCGWRSGKRTTIDAMYEALQTCRTTGAGCQLYAVGNEYAPGTEHPPVIWRRGRCSTGGSHARGLHTGMLYDCWIRSDQK